MYENKNGIIKAISQEKKVIMVEGYDKWLIAKKDNVKQILLSLNKGDKVEFNFSQEDSKKEIELTFVRKVGNAQEAIPARYTQPSPHTLRHLNPVLGLDSNDVKQFEQFKAKANKEQIEAMIKDLESQYLRL